MASSIAFPSAPTPRQSMRDSTITNMSVVSLHATALEKPSIDITKAVQTSAVYENPFMTATSRTMIADIYQLTRQLSQVDVPKPLAMFATLFRLNTSKGRNDTLFQGLRVWSELGEISESESFDGHRKAIVEHTLNVLLLPGLHSDRQQSHTASSSSLSLPFSTTSHHPTVPGLPVPGTSISLPSPFHLQLHVITRLSFNEQGRITHHRDFWDVKDLMGLVPGMGVAQWIGGRVAARGLALAGKVLTSWRRESHEYMDERSFEERSVSSASEDLEYARGSSEITPAAVYGAKAKNALGLSGLSS